MAPPGAAPYVTCARVEEAVQSPVGACVCASWLGDNVVGIGHIPSMECLLYQTLMDVILAAHVNLSCQMLSNWVAR
jgi:hypothetical protein